jgi:hypothetical protein
MSYSLRAAAKATGLNRRTILQAIKGGKINATRDELGKWYVESAELHRVYPAVEGRNAGSDAAQQPAAPGDAALEPQIDAIQKGRGASSTAARRRASRPTGEAGLGASARREIIRLRLSPIPEKIDKLTLISTCAVFLDQLWK